MTARRGRPDASNARSRRPIMLRCGPSPALAVPIVRRMPRSTDLDALLVGRRLMAGQLVVVADRLPMVLALRPCWAGLRDSWRPR